MLNLPIVSTFLVLCMTSLARGTGNLPNILLLLSDDQDVELHGMFPLQRTRELFASSGAQLHNVYTPTPLCCPSRASVLTGQYAHNHRTLNNSYSGGCYGSHWREKMEPQALPVLLKQQGYRTFYAGKYLNHYSGDEVPPGWDEFYGLHGNSRYYNYTLRENERNVSYMDMYLTDLLKERALSFIRNATQQEGQPFFAIIAPPAAHAPYTPAPRHAGLFANVKALRTPSFNQLVKTPLDKHWLVASSKALKQNTLATIDKYFQQRWETLLAVDEMVAELAALLDVTEAINDTYIIYTSDNGYHMGQFAQPFDKRQPYETDIRVPLLIRGPGVPVHCSLHVPISLLDLAPTILDWAGGLIPEQMNGRSIKQDLEHCHDEKLDGASYQRTLLIEYWGEGNSHTFNPKCPWQLSDNMAGCTLDADCHCQDTRNNSYACVRDFRYHMDRIYCEFQDKENFVEAYDLAQDPYQMNNLGFDMLPIERALYSLLLHNLTKCAGPACYT
ncbi:N-acetylglucosamine-6-sulfatase-like [Scaptodrosophila lebanonensis]|uniref:N-acetylglucosamine-6-sulfatase-like n=1 Tax=Drosophila lebanonensis TaxID=7225 RepID=A0A6J2UIQ9_DROLE|nr:N-acetylglucosamine-6-sulfatase-like [Scaptodrosophila lebanonensis]